MIERLSRTKRNVALALLAALLVWFAWTIRSVLNPVLLGYLCAFILHPVVVAIEQRGFSRRTAVNLAFAGGALLAAVVTILLALQIRALAVEVHTQATSDAMQTRLDGLRENVQQRFGVDTGRIDVSALAFVKEQATEFLDDYRSSGDEERVELRKNITAAAKTGVAPILRGVGLLAGVFGRVFQLGAMFLLLPLYAYYFLFVHKRMNEFLEGCVPKHARERVSRTAVEIGQVIASFFRGRLGVSFIKGILIWLGLWLCGIKFAFLIGMLSGALSVIPFIGPFLGFLLAFAVGVLTPDLSGLEPGVLPDLDVLAILLRTGVVFGVAEILEGYVLVPRILGDSLGLHPLVVFIALLAGGAAFGMLGVLIALPLTASAVIVFKEFALPALRDFAEEDDAPAEPGG